MDDPSIFPPLNAALNGTAALLMVAGFMRIRAGDEATHKKLMLGAFGVSILFLCSYLYYHLHFGVSVQYAGPSGAKIPYLLMLLTHTVLAAAVPFLALRTIWLGLKNRRVSHKKWARFTFPIWLYVSLTGVLIYLVLYVFTDSSRIAFEGLGP
ncbi:MAG: DUF420 domain-containing protein [Planctomycetes bacterium]|nr:DUF420 domain-containing protein [Planctomycetota bacterium]MCP4771278.1 DUF420 domain-containing protein [Planctomycetota bacterium]MCP4861995.1 DUF420 domain-containing protein [Planctomycetota bacterium]